MADVEAAYWSCTRCSRSFPVSVSWAVVFDSAGRQLRFVVCPDCALRYQIPRPVTLDLNRCPPPDRASRDVKIHMAAVAASVFAEWPARRIKFDLETAEAGEARRLRQANGSLDICSGTD